MLYCAELLSSVRFFAMSWTVACQDPLSMGKVLERVAMPSSRGSSQPRDWTRSPALQVDSLPAEPLGKSKNTGVGSLSNSPGDLPNPGIEPGSPSLQANSLPTEFLVHVRPLINEWINPHIWRPWYIILPDLTFQWTPSPSLGLPPGPSFLLRWTTFCCCVRANESVPENMHWSLWACFSSSLRWSHSTHGSLVDWKSRGDPVRSASKGTTEASACSPAAHLGLVVALLCWKIVGSVVWTHTLHSALPASPSWFFPFLKKKKLKYTLLWFFRENS